MYYLIVVINRKIYKEKRRLFFKVIKMVDKYCPHVGICPLLNHDSQHSLADECYIVRINFYGEGGLDLDKCPFREERDSQEFDIERSQGERVEVFLNGARSLENVPKQINGIFSGGRA